MKSTIAVLAAVFALAAAAPSGQRVRRQCAPSSGATPPPTSVDSSAAPTSTDSSTSPANTGSPPPPSGGSQSSGAHFSVYADQGVDGSSWPSSGDLGKWNDFLLAFYTDKPADIADVWASIDNSTKTSIVNDYHSAGKTIRVSAFGETYKPLKSGGDPTTLANQLIQYVKDNQLDGVDVDYEDSDSFNANGDGENFLITMTKALRAGLPSPQYVITHAPQGPYFTSAGWYPKGAYLAVDKEVGSLIDWYNVQFYNQGNGTYDTCDELLTKSSIAGTSVGEMITAGIPANKIVIGKPGTTAQASNGYMDPATLGGCIQAASTKPGGVMSWEWVGAKSDWIASASGGL